jgi:hypothetical protein
MPEFCNLSNELPCRGKIGACSKKILDEDNTVNIIKPVVPKTSALFCILNCHQGL